MKIKTFRHNIDSITKGEMDAEINRFMSDVIVNNIIVNSDISFGHWIVHTIVYEDKAPKSKKKS